jgi:amino acid adenylation domain-containing protein
VHANDLHRPLLASPSDRVAPLLNWLRNYAKNRVDAVRLQQLRLPPSLVADFGNRGILGAPLPTEVGGLGLPRRDVLALVQQTAAIDIGLAAFLVLHYTSSAPFAAYARPNVRDRYLPDLARGRVLASFALTEPAAGSNPRAMRTTVRRTPEGRFRIQGQKTWIGNAEWAAVLTTFARHEDGDHRISAFAVPRDAAGLTIEPEIETLGLKPTVQNPVTLGGVEVAADHLLGELGSGLDIAEHVLAFGRLATGAIALGGMKRCAQIMSRFADRRAVNTGRLSENSVTRERLARADGAITGVSALLERLLAEEAQGRPPPPEAYMALKVAGSELLFSTVDDTLQLLGSRGYAETNGVPALFRDSRFLRIGEGPSETLLMQIGANVAHAEPTLRAFIAAIGGRAAEEQLFGVARTLDKLGGVRETEALYERLGQLAMWQMLSASAAAALGVEPSAALWVEQQLHDVAQRVGRPSRAVFDRAAWDRALGRHDAEVGSLDESWPIPDRVRDPYLRQNHAPDPVSSRAAQTQADTPRADETAREASFRVDVPTDRSYRQRSAPRTWAAASGLAPTTALALDALAGSLNTHADHLLLAIFGAFLFRLSEQSDLMLIHAVRNEHQLPSAGVALAIRPAETLETLVAALSGEFRPRWPNPAAALEARSGGGLVSDRLVAGGISVAFAYSDDGWTAADEAFTGVDLSLVGSREGRQLKLAWKYDRLLFEEATIARRHANFEVFLASAIANPTSPLGELDLLPVAERTRVVDEFAGQRTDPSYHEHTIHGLIEAQVDRTPSALAIETPSERLTYAELDERANRLAHVLRARGIQPSDTVALHTSRSSALVVGALGVLKTGARFVILNVDHPAERRAWILAETAAKAVIVDRAQVETLPKTGAVGVLLDGAGGDLAGTRAGRPEVKSAPADVAYVMFTSGSTGNPKGVLLPHRAIANQMLARRDELGLGPEDRVLQAAAPNFDIAAWEILGPLVFGGSVVLSGEADFSWDAGALLRTIDQQRITVLQIVPSQLALLLDQVKGRQCASLRFVICGGESLQKPLQQRFFESAAQGLYNFYGPTEGAIDTSWWRCLPDDPSSSAPIGRACTNRRVYVLDRSFRPTPIGVPGELFIGGVGIALGYLNNATLTKERFLPDPFAGDPSAQMYRTGDRVRFRSDGALEFLGRVDRQIKVRGVRIEPDEIEITLTRHPNVAACAVAVRPTIRGDKRLAAYVVARGEPRPTGRELRAFAQAHLPAEMMPSAFVLLDSLPKTSSGKLDLSSLPPVDWSTVDGGRPERGEAASTDVQRALADIWTETLARRIDDVEADFFELGGDSLLAVQVVSRVRDRFGLEVTVRDLFDQPTLRDLAARIESALAAATASRVQARDAAPAPVLLGEDDGTTPLYLVAPPGAGAEVYEGLRGHVSLPAFSFQSDGGGSVESLAEQYLEQLRRHRRGGAVLLGAFGSAGAIAFEMARRLEDRGEGVEALVLFDAPPPSSGRVKADVALFRPREARRVSDLDLGWSDRASARLYVVDVPGEHSTMMSGDNAAALARRMDAVLRCLRSER